MAQVTIGLAVFNGAETIGAALDSLLAQTFRDFRIVICDNASTDLTLRICDACAAGDARVRIVRHAQNVGRQENFRLALFEADTPYFMWAAADDVWAPDFIAAHMIFLRANPGYAASQSKVLFHTGGQPGKFAGGTFALAGTAGENTLAFFRASSDNSRFYGLFRTSVLRDVFPEPGLFAFDWVVSAATLQHGCHHEAPAALMLRDATPTQNYALEAMDFYKSALPRAFPMAQPTLYLLRHNLLPVGPAGLAALVKMNLHVAVRFAAYRFNARVQAARAGSGPGGLAARMAGRLVNAIAAPGLGARAHAALRQLSSRFWPRAGIGPPVSRKLPVFSGAVVDITIIAILRNDVRDALALMQALQQVGSSVSFELILADSVSTDITQLCLSSRDDLNYIRCDATAGFGEVANAAAKRARGGWLLFLEPGALPRYGLLGEIVQASADAGLFALRQTGQISDDAPRGFAVPRACFDQLGGFDAACRSFAAAEADLSHRIEIVARNNLPPG